MKNVIAIVLSQSDGYDMNTIHAVYLIKKGKDFNFDFEYLKFLSQELTAIGLKSQVVYQNKTRSYDIEMEKKELTPREKKEMTKINKMYTREFFVTEVLKGDKVPHVDCYL